MERENHITNIYYRHNYNPEITCNKVISLVNFFLKKKKLIDFHQLISETIDIDKKNINFYIKKTFLNSFDLKKGFFVEKIKFIHSIFYLVIAFFFLFFKLLKRKAKFIKKKKLIIDNIGSNFELKAYEPLLKYINKNQIIVRSTNKFISSNKFKIDFFKKDSINFKEFLKYFNLILKSFTISCKLNVNLVYFVLKIIKDYIFYSCFFEQYRAKNIIMHQHYLSNNIKNLVFKKKGGLKTILIQKNINTRNNNGYFYSADLVIGFSKNSRINKYETHSKIKNFLDLGSFFLQNNLKYIKKKKYKFDILFLGGNDLCPNGYYDSYNKYGKDYLDQLNWLKKIADEIPDITIGFKHHTNNTNKYEEDFFKDSRVKVINQKINSYTLAYNSNFLVSWASTMILEMFVFRKQGFFLNPGYRNVQFLKDLKFSKKISLNTFEKFKKKFLEAKRNKFKLKFNSNLNLCNNQKLFFRKIFNELL